MKISSLVVGLCLFLNIFSAENITIGNVNDLNLTSEEKKAILKYVNFVNFYTNPTVTKQIEIYNADKGKLHGLYKNLSFEISKKKDFVIFYLDENKECKSCHCVNVTYHGLYKTLRLLEIFKYHIYLVWECKLVPNDNEKKGIALHESLLSIFDKEIISYY